MLKLPLRRQGWLIARINSIEYDACMQEFRIAEGDSFMEGLHYCV